MAACFPVPYLSPTFKDYGFYIHCLQSPSLPHQHLCCCLSPALLPFGQNDCKNLIPGPLGHCCPSSLHSTQHQSIQECKGDRATPCPNAMSTLITEHSTQTLHREGHPSGPTLATCLHASVTHRPISYTVQVQVHSHLQKSCADHSAPSFPSSRPQLKHPLQTNCPI